MYVKIFVFHKYYFSTTVLNLYGQTSRTYKIIGLFSMEQSVNGKLNLPEKKNIYIYISRKGEKKV
jgi:hypothetical protein